MITTNVVCAKDSIRELEDLLSHIKYSNNSHSIDARAKINFINESGERVIICMNLSDVCVNGRLIEEYPVFMEFLRSLIPKKQLAVR